MISINLLCNLCSSFLIVSIGVFSDHVSRKEKLGTNIFGRSWFVGGIVYDFSQVFEDCVFVAFVSNVVVNQAA